MKNWHPPRDSWDPHGVISYMVTRLQGLGTEKGGAIPTPAPTQWGFCVSGLGCGLSIKAPVPHLTPHHRRGCAESLGRDR